MSQYFFGGENFISDERNAWNGNQALLYKISSDGAHNRPSHDTDVKGSKAG